MILREVESLMVLLSEAKRFLRTGDNDHDIPMPPLIACVVVTREYEKAH